MFKMLKYYVLVNLYRRSRKNIMVIVVSLMLMVLVSYLFTDLIAIGEHSTHLMMVKWMVYLVLLSIVLWNMRKIKSIVILPFFNDSEKQIVDVKKDVILQKQQLRTRNELIIDKYRDVE